METLVFLSDRNRYLEHELYLTLVADLKKDFHCVYLDSEFKEQVNYNSSKEEDREEKKAVFDAVVYLPRPQHNKGKLTSPLAKLKRIFSNLSLTIRWRKTLLKTISEKNPKAIVMVAPNNVNALVVRKFRKDLKLIYLQPATIRRTTIAPQGRQAALNRFWYNRILRVPRYTALKPVFEVAKELHFILWSELWVEAVAKRANTHFYACGAPAYDRYFQSFSSSKPVPINARVAVFLNKEGHDPKDFETYAKFYQGLVKANPDLHFTFKMHPLGDFEKCQKLFPDSQVTKASIAWDEIDLVLTHWSTVGFDAMAMGIPTILINPAGQFDFVERYMDQYEGIAESIEGFAALLQNFQDQNHTKFPAYRQKFMELSLFSTDGRSKERVVHQIKSIAAA